MINMRSFQVTQFTANQFLIKLLTAAMAGALLLYLFSATGANAAPAGINWPEKSAEVTVFQVADPSDGAWYPRLLKLANGEILAAYDTNDGTVNPRVQISRSQNSGQTWSVLATSASFSTGAAANGQLLQLANGDILCAYRAIEGSNYYIKVSKSTDGGATWSHLSTVKTNTKGVWEPHMDFLPNGNIAVMYANEEYNADSPAYPQVIEMKRSSDSGATWGSQQIVSRNTNSRDGMPVWTKAANGDLITVIEASDETNPFVVKYVRSTDGGTTWGARTLIYKPADTSRRAIAPYITKLQDGRLLVSYGSDEYASVTGLTQADAHGIISSNNGFNWQQSHRIWDTAAGDNWNSLLTLDANTVIAATSTNDDGEDRIRIRFGQLTSEADEFNSTNLGGQWHWVQQDAAKWSLSARSGYMRITTQYGDLWQTSTTYPNVLQQKAPSHDYDVVTKLDFDPTQNYQQAGIVLNQDTDNYIKLVKVYADGKKIEIAKEVNGTFTATNVAAPAGNVVYLKVSKRGTTYTGYYSTDNSTWTLVGSWTGIALNSEKMGLIALNGQITATSINADFDYFHVNQIDFFSSSTLNNAWSWVRQDSTHWSLSALSGYMRITTQTGDLHTTTNNAKNLLLQTAPGTDFKAYTTLTFDPTQDYHHAGIIVYQDDGNYIKLVKIHAGSKRIEIAKEINGSFTPTNVAAPTGTTVQLRLDRVGTTYTAYYSTDGTNWTQVGSFTSINFKAPKVGFLAINGSNIISEKTADFDHFTITTH
ncbi:MAG TPA: DUF1349 domain-containing protein [Bacilli bacterium]